MRLYFDGIHDLIVQKLKGDFSDFEGTAKKFDLAAKLDVTFTQPQTIIAVDDDPVGDIINGIPTAKATLTLKGIHINQFSDFVSCISNTKGVRFGERLPVVPLAFSVSENVTDGSENRHIFYKCCATNIPDFKPTTRVNGELPVRDVAIELAIYTLFYKKLNGERGGVIYDIYNSVLHKTAFDANKDTIVYPSELTVE